MSHTDVGDRLAEIEAKFQNKNGTLLWMFCGEVQGTFDSEAAWLIQEVKRQREELARKHAEETAAG